VNRSVAERQILQDAIGVGRVNDGGLAEVAAALGAFALGQVAEAGAAVENLAGAGYLEPLGHGFFRFDAFGTSHNIFISIAKGRALYAADGSKASVIFYAGLAWRKF
jgi:hypothetical protein